MMDHGECDECKYQWFPDVPSEEVHADGCSKGAGRDDSEKESQADHDHT